MKRYEVSGGLDSDKENRQKYTQRFGGGGRTLGEVQIVTNFTYM
jgi:hypothetical protein